MTGTWGSRGVTRAQLGSRWPCPAPQGDVGEKGPERAPGKDGARVSETGTEEGWAGQGHSWWPIRDVHGGQ